MNPRDPQEALKLLKQLQAFGFDDKPFGRLHHNQDAKHPRWEPIGSFWRYCENTKGEFPADGNNERVTRRLERVLQRYLGLPTGSRSAAVFEQFAEEAYAEIPRVL
jgi:hypothetical protein